MSSALCAVDEQLALQRAGGNTELARDLYQLLQNELPEYQSRLPSLYADGDLHSLQEAVHKLNGSATYCGVPALKVAVDALESSLKRGEKQSYAEKLAKVLNEIQRVLETPTLTI